MAHSSSDRVFGSRTTSNHEHGLPTGPEVAEIAQNWLRQTEKAVKEHPGLALTAAVAIGVALGWIVKRK